MRPPTIREHANRHPGGMLSQIVDYLPEEFQQVRPILFPIRTTGKYHFTGKDIVPGRNPSEPKVLTNGGQPLTKEKLLQEIVVHNEAMKKAGFSIAQRLHVNREVQQLWLQSTDLIEQHNMIHWAFAESGVFDGVFDEMRRLSQGA